MKPALVILASLFLASTACQRTEEGRASAAAEMAPDISRNAAMDQERDQYVDTMKARLDEMGKKIDGLEVRADAMKGSPRERLSTDIKLLRDQKQMVLDKLDYVEEVTPESWAKLKTYVDSDFLQLESSYENISARHDFR
jgi:hypothetical protein